MPNRLLTDILEKAYFAYTWFDVNFDNSQNGIEGICERTLHFGVFVYQHEHTASGVVYSYPNSMSSRRLTSRVRIEAPLFCMPYLIKLSNCTVWAEGAKNRSKGYEDFCGLSEKIRIGFILLFCIMCLYVGAEETYTNDFAIGQLVYSTLFYDRVRQPRH